MYIKKGHKKAHKIFLKDIYLTKFLNFTGRKQLKFK